MSRMAKKVYDTNLMKKTMNYYYSTWGEEYSIYEDTKVNKKDKTNMMSSDSMNLRLL